MMFNKIFGGVCLLIACAAMFMAVQADDAGPMVICMVVVLLAMQKVLNR